MYRALGQLIIIVFLVNLAQHLFLHIVWGVFTLSLVKLKC